jgi:hypothetical protein
MPVTRRTPRRTKEPMSQLRDKQRSFELALPGGTQTVHILNVMVYEGNVVLVVKAERPKPYVLEVIPGGLRFPTTVVSDRVIADHEAEVEGLRVASGI